MLVLAALAFVTPPRAIANTSATHKWQRITYPSVPIPGLDGGALSLRVQSSIRAEKPRLRFDVLWNTGRDTPIPKELADPKQFTARLHLSDGRMILPSNNRPPSWMGAGSLGITYSLIYNFPWQENDLSEAWIEFSLPGQTYWVELPYGFARDPAAPLASATKSGKPEFPSSMKSLSEADRLVPWLYVEYELGKIQNDWHLMLQIANPYDTRAEVTLYREPQKTKGSLRGWQTDSPKTSIEIRGSDGRIVAANPDGIHLHGDGLRRTDTFSVNRNPGDTREWGTIVIKIDDQPYECAIPSSLFKSTHGVTDPGSKQRLPRPHRTLQSGTSGKAGGLR